MPAPDNVDEYLALFPQEIRQRMESVRQAIREAAPQAAEVISYSMPGYKWHRLLVWFAGYQGHVGFYPGASGIMAFKEELTEYKHAKGSVQFPHNKPLPLDLIKRMVKFRVEEQEKRMQIKK